MFARTKGLVRCMYRVESFARSSGGSCLMTSVARPSRVMACIVVCVDCTRMTRLSAGGASTWRSSFRRSIPSRRPRCGQCVRQRVLVTVQRSFPMMMNSPCWSCLFLFLFCWHGFVGSTVRARTYIHASCCTPRSTFAARGLEKALPLCSFEELYSREGKGRAKLEPTSPPPPVSLFTCETSLR